MKNAFLATLLLLSSTINAQSLDWVKSFGGTSYDDGLATTVDASGNVYVVGRFQGTVDFDPGVGVNNFTSNGSSDIYIQKLNASGDLVWIKTFGGTGYDNAYAIVVDGAGNVYTTGEFRNAVDFDPGTGVQNRSSAGGSDIFVQKLDASGDFVWARTFGGSDNDEGYGVTLDHLNNVLITGNFEGNVNFNNGAGFYYLNSAGDADVFVQKLDASGTLIWAQSFGGTGNQSSIAIATDASGNIYTTGYFLQTVDFAPGPSTFNLTSAGGADIFIHKLSPSGAFQWVKNIGGTGSDFAKSIITDDNGNIYTLGRFEGTADLNTGSGTLNATAIGGTDVFIQKLNPSGDFLWANYFGGMAFDYGNGMCIDNSGNVYITGQFNGTVDFDPGNGTLNLTSAGSSDIYVQKVDASGSLIWAQSYGSTGIDSGTFIAIDDSENLYTIGRFQLTVDFDPEAGTTNLSSVGNADVFVQKISQCAPVTGTDVQTACNTFTWIDGLTYTSSNNTATHNIVGGAANGCDSLVTLDLTIVNSATGTDVQTACNTFIWIDGLTYTSSNNTATHNIVGGAANGCDSLVTLDLTILNSATGTDVQTACNTFTWMDGLTYTSSNNTATHNIVGGAANGCDSLVTLDLTILNSVTGTDVQTACNTFTWIDGLTYTSSNNTATHNIVGGAANGCDSLVTLDLTIVNSVTGTDVQTACNTFTWIDGLTYTSSNNTATHNIVGGAANGCDSLVTLDLTIVSSVTGTDVQTACNSFTWIDGLTYTSSNNTATHNIVGGAVNGCDSLVTLDLTIVSSVTGTDVQTACNSFTWIDGLTYTSNNNTATHNIVGGAANGCDSLVTLDLTILNSATGTDVQTACSTFTWINGLTYTSNNNTATHNIVGGAANGCDSLVTLDLTILNSATGTDVQTACNTFTWINGLTYTSSNNTATHNIVGGAANGCDSLVTLDLTILNSATGVDVQTACNTFTWINGLVYTSSNNTATHNIVGGAANGCDSLVTLDLTILNSATGTDVQTACNTFTWIDGLTYTSNNNTATHNIVGGAANGCDSLVTLDLTILNSATGTDVQTACNTFTWIDGLTYTSSNNTATHNIVGGAANGCDSLVTLDLTILNSATGTDVQTACNTFTWIDGLTYTSSNNTATHNIVGGAANGCDSLVTLDLTINNVSDVTTSLNGITITANNGSATYRWLDCNNNYAVIVGETNQSFTPDVNGDYAVEITENNCVDTSDCVSVTTVGNDLIEDDMIFSVYPNPTNDKVHVSLKEEASELRVVLTNVFGQQIIEEYYTTSSNFTVELPEQTGIYYLTLISTKGRYTTRLVKK